MKPRFVLPRLVTVTLPHMFDCITCSYADAFPSDDRSTAIQDDHSSCSPKVKTTSVVHERDSLLVQLQQAKREIKILKTEQQLCRLEIEKLKAEREQVRNVLDGKHGPHRDVLDSVFDW